MERIEDGSIGIEAQRKMRWRTPELTQEKVGDATGIDPVPSGNDGQTTTHGAPLGQTS